MGIFSIILSYYFLCGVEMPFKIDSAIMKLDSETGKYDLVDPDGKFNKKDALMVVESDDLLSETTLKHGKMLSGMILTVSKLFSLN